MHIVFIHRGVYPERIGGTYSYIYELGRRLASRGHRVRVIASTSEPVAPAPYEHEGMLIHKYAFRRINPVASTLQHLTKTQRTFEKIVATEPVDVLTVHDSQLGYRLAKSALGRSVCQLPTFHAPGFLEYRLRAQWKLGMEPSPVRRALIRLAEPPMEYGQRRCEEGILRCASGIHVLSQYSRGHIENHFKSVDLSKVTVIPGGVDAARFRPAEDRQSVRERTGIADGTTELLTVRNLSPRMGIENLIKATRMVLDAQDDGDTWLHLTVCGEGVLRGTLESLIASLGLSQSVSLAGRVTNEELVHHYQAADLFVLPTTAMEGFGISTVEALSANLPVVGTPAGATPEILNAIDPRLITRDTSAEAIAESTISWLGRRTDEVGTTRYRDEVLEKYDWDAVAERMESWYAEEVERFARQAE